MTYKIHEIAKLANVSVRTLHYYDEIGLLEPSQILENGYREYGKKELFRLQQILFFRELDFSLTEIREILDNPNFDLEKALSGQRKLIKLKIERFEKLLKTVERTIEKRKENMKDEDLFEGFDEEKIEQYKKEAKERWGNTDAYKESEKRTKNWSKDDFTKVAKEWDAIAKSYVDNMEKSFDSEEVQAVVQTHWDQINKFYTCTKEIFTGLANMYVEDERFAANYRRYHKDLPEFIRDAMLYYCKKQ